MLFISCQQNAFVLVLVFRPFLIKLSCLSIAIAIRTHNIAQCHINTSEKANTFLDVLTTCMFMCLSCPVHGLVANLSMIHNLDVCGLHWEMCGIASPIKCEHILITIMFFSIVAVEACKHVLLSYFWCSHKLYIYICVCVCM